MGTNTNRGGRLNGRAWIIITDQDAALALGTYLHRRKPAVQQQTFVESGEALERALVEPAPHVLLTRYSNRRESDTRHLLGQLRGIPRFARVPCIVLARPGEIPDCARAELAALGTVGCFKPPVDDDPALAELVAWFCTSTN